MPPIDYSIKDIDKLLKVDGKVKHVEVSRLTAPGENYVSLVLRVNVEVEKNGHSKTLSAVAKRLPMGDHKFLHMNVHAMKNEIAWYTNIVSLLKDFAKECGIDFDIFPKYYGSRFSLDPSEKNPDKDSVLLMENLIPEGYRNEDRYIGFDLPATKEILRTLALFHALPIALKLNKPVQFKILKDFLDTTKPQKPPGAPDGPGPFQRPGEKRPEEVFLDAINTIPDCAPYISRIMKLLKQDPKDFHSIGPEPWNTVVHTDFWVNNIMIKEEKNGHLVKIVDYQMCSYGSLAKDLVFFLLCSVRNDVIKDHMDDLLRFYFDELRTYLKRTKTNLELTYNDFLEEVKRSAKKELGHCFFFSTIIFGEKGTGHDTAVEGFDPLSQMTDMIKKMNDAQKEKLVVMASEAARRDWF